MQSYDTLIYEMIPGNTPKEKHDILEKILKVVKQVGWPDPEFEDFSSADFAQEFQEILEENDNGELVPYSGDIVWNA